MKILIVDDQRSARRVVREILADVPEVEVVEADSDVTAIAMIEREAPDLLLLDVRLSADVRDRGGLDLLHQLRASGTATPAVMITSVTELSGVREAMRMGAQDYVFKDELSPELLVPIIEGFRERLSLRRDVQRLLERVDTTWGTQAIIGSSAAIEHVRKLVKRVADASSTVLIRGATGSGKEMVARAIHASSGRRSEPFVAVNCSALPGSLIESLVFGHEKGAFTGAQRRSRGQLELAGRGTILLDEIAEMPPDLQAKLLRVLEERTFRPLGAETDLPLHARVLAATHVDIERRIAEGRFREDLFFRLNVVAIDVPSLADRVEDIPEFVLRMAADQERKLTFAAPAIEWLKRRRWPGNVRELRNAIERLALLAESDEIDVAALETVVPERRSADDPDIAIERIARAVLALPDEVGPKLRAVERAVLELALATSAGNKSAAARYLGVDRKFLERRWDRLADPE